MPSATSEIEPRSDRWPGPLAIVAAGAIMLAWTVAALVGGYLVLVRTDVTGGRRRWRMAARAR